MSLWLNDCLPKSDYVYVTHLYNKMFIQVNRAVLAHTAQGVSSAWLASTLPLTAKKYIYIYTYKNCVCHININCFFSVLFIYYFIKSFLVVIPDWWAFSLSLHSQRMEIRSYELHERNNFYISPDVQEHVRTFIVKFSGFLFFFPI